MLFVSAPRDTAVEREPPRRQKRGPLARREERLAFILLAPVLIAVLALGFYPAVNTLWSSLQGGDFLANATQFVGFTNFARLMKDQAFLGAFRFSVFYSVVTVTGQLVLGTALALLANQKFPGRWVVRAAILFPWVIPTATNSIIWAYMFNDQYGLVNSLLIHAHLMSAAHPHIWLSTATSAIGVLFGMVIWKANSFVALLVLAGLQTIPDELYEAARVDGANRWQIFRSVMVPLLLPTLIVVLIVRTIESFQAFDTISALTDGGPGIATQNLGIYLYRQIGPDGFMDYGYGSSIATVVMLVSLVFVVIYLRALYRPGLR